MTEVQNRVESGTTQIVDLLGELTNQSIELPGLEVAKITPDVDVLAISHHLPVVTPAVEVDVLLMPTSVVAQADLLDSHLCARPVQERGLLGDFAHGGRTAS